MATEILTHNTIILPSAIRAQKPTQKCSENSKDCEKNGNRTPLRSRKITPHIESNALSKAWNNPSKECEGNILSSDSSISNSKYSESSDEEQSVLISSSFSSPKDSVLQSPQYLSKDLKTPCKYISLPVGGNDAVKVSCSGYEHLISPVSTTAPSPEESFIAVDILKNIRSKNESEKSYTKFLCPPYFILAASLIEISVFLWGSKDMEAWLVYSPHERQQLWRFATYMLLHSGMVHLTLNIIIQTLLATPLELEQGSWRCAVVYLGGGVAGALGASVIQPTLYMVGASAGVYALLMSHLANVVVGFSRLRYKVFRVFSVVVLAGSDISFSVAHLSLATSPRIGWAAHCAGALAGAILGMIVYKGRTISERRARWIGHIMRHDCLLHDIVEGMVERRICRGRPRREYLQQVFEDMSCSSYAVLKRIAKDREEWRSRCKILWLQTNPPD